MVPSLLVRVFLMSHCYEKTIRWFRITSAVWRDHLVNMSLAAFERRLNVPLSNFVNDELPKMLHFDMENNCGCSFNNLGTMHSRNTSSLNLVLALLCSPNMDIYTKYWR